MKIFLTAVICCLILLGSMAWADAPSIWGYVYDDTVAVEGAWVYISADGGQTTYTNEDGYYVFSPIWAGTYWMEAEKGQKNDIITGIYYDGGAGGKQVDFHLTYDPK